MDENSSDDESFFRRKALFVQSPTRPITLDTIPLDGHEFIHKSRLEQDRIVRPNKLSEKEKLKHHAREMAREFIEYAEKLNTDKESLREKFPLTVELPEKNERKWCKFCLGSEIYNEIYNEVYENEESRNVIIEGHSPLLSIIVHLEQKVVKSVLKFLRRWCKAVGMRKSIGMWLYCLLACLEKPIDQNCQKMIARLEDTCKKRLKVCEESEKQQLHVMREIVDLYFSVY
ncbi:uncharacterized protein NPIL_323221 [Nephila pilipes]|uniref:Gem-associated protein 2 n=1 Tax=Nephila pilipes TaxID=299642 RepID=A0A8X6TEI1_NEPPI|nr:uncharacterized protein NPIL_323221 [Nephila pilipes]